MGMLAKMIAENRIAPLPTEGKTAFLFAHPDDETLFAGTSAHISQEDGKTYSYYATLGEAGMTNNLCSQEELAHVRLAELIHAENILKFTKVITPDPNRPTFHDGQLQEEWNELAEDILSQLHSIRPDRIITFPPSGITRHADHQMMLLAGWEALQRYVQETDQPIEFYCRMIPSWARGIEGEGEKSDLIMHDKLVPTHYVDVRPYAHKIKEVLLAHKTQQPALSTIYPVLRTEGQPTDKIHTHEYYTRVFSRE